MELIMRFEKKLKLLFDAQGFFRDPQLEAVIEWEAKALSMMNPELPFAASRLFTAEKKENDGTKEPV